MRFTYARALAPGHPEAYALARDSAHALATDFFLPSLVACVALMMAGLALIRIARRTKIENPRA